MLDIMDLVKQKSITCLDKGHVTLIDVMPRVVPEDRNTVDLSVA